MTQSRGGRIRGNIAALVAASVLLALGGCTGLFQRALPAVPQSYAVTVPAADTVLVGSAERDMGSWMGMGVGVVMDGDPNYAKAEVLMEQEDFYGPVFVVRGRHFGEVRAGVFQDDEDEEADELGWEDEA